MANRIWEYLGTWGLAKFLGRQAFVPKVTFDWLLPIFPDLDLPIYEEIKHCNLSLQRIREVDSLDTLKERVQGQHLIFEKWYVLPRVVLPYLDEARKLFRFADDLVLKVNQTIRAVGGEGRVLVAVHVRRTDYIGFLVNRYHLTIANKFYYLDAMDWFRKNIGGKLLFLIVSDDPPWCELNLLGQEDVVMASKDTYHDLALLTLADHNIIDYGTYGAFAGLMTKGHTVTLFSIDFDQVMAKYKNWHVMDERKYMTKLQ
ncbi:galactoside 2-alpha-L-fucosyltransferase SEC1-like [Neocloeon triangulifer]|uniref:galactoside 2-alpha-L-fucosyltransferase SEC1-like n=1 Tax=Neocloeon triangulifer TaxID=2078957 RepID=UPI00286F9F30|nr:galactoside 2-alpha-L-fucosyltransferase SEC1-like [Neocloeon triangulifer]